MRASFWSAATLVWILFAGGDCPAAAAGARDASADPQRVRAEEPAAEEKAGKELQALRLDASTIRIDGRVDDEPWMRAATISDFVQEEPDNLMPPTETTTVRVVYDDR